MTFSARIRALCWFFVAVIYFIFARAIAERAANGLASGDWLEFVNRTLLLFLLIVGYAAMGYVGQRQREPIKAMGLARRPGWGHEFAIGAALGWSGMVASVFPMALIGGLVITFYTTPRQFGLIFVNLAILAIAALADEVVFRGYPFQRLIDATGPTIATLGMSVLYGIIHLGNPGATTASTMVTILAGWLLAIAYLRTRALWVGWGFHFAWNATMGVLFGLPISGITSFSPVVSSNTIGPPWITGGDYGPEGSLVCAVVLIVLIFVMFAATRDLKHRYAQPVIVPGGIPVDIDALSRRQHEAAMGPQT
ncbi:MAG TPA: type II CAAX endopeptidase family protein, partial [Silvibacterium sp.]|nr:type II CAAX endopeptidase family protein [Silvibacterium sp.]